jgi:hypothetical protein
MALRLPVHDKDPLPVVEASERDFNSFMLAMYAAFQVLLWGLVINAYISGAPERITRATPVAFVIAVLPAGFAYWAERGLLVADIHATRREKVKAYIARIVLIACCVEVHSLPLRMFFAGEAIDMRAHLEAVAHKGLDLLREHQRLAAREENVTTRNKAPLPQADEVDAARTALKTAVDRAGAAKAAVTRQQSTLDAEKKRASALSNQLARATAERVTALRGMLFASKTKIEALDVELRSLQAEQSAAERAVELAQKRVDTATGRLNTAWGTRERQQHDDVEKLNTERRRIRIFLERIAASPPGKAARDGDLVFEPKAIDWTTRGRILQDIEEGRPRLVVGSPEAINELRDLAPSVVIDDSEQRARQSEAAARNERIAKLLLAVLDAFGLLSHLIGGARGLRVSFSRDAAAAMEVLVACGFKADKASRIVIDDAEIVREILTTLKEERKRIALEKILGAGEEDILRLVREHCGPVGDAAATPAAGASPVEKATNEVAS